MAEHALSLYFAPDTCSQVVHIALEELGLSFDAHPMALMAGEHKSLGYLAINPSGKVPTLVVDGRPLVETLAILQWLDAMHPGGLMPDHEGDMFARAQDWSLVSWFASTAHPVLTRFRVPPAVTADPSQFAAVAGFAAPVLEGYLRQLAERLESKEWLLGTYSAADIFLAWLWREAIAGGFDRASYADLEDHRRRVDARPAVDRALQRETAAIADFMVRGIGMTPAPLSC